MTDHLLGDGPLYAFSLFLPTIVEGVSKTLSSSLEMADLWKRWATDQHEHSFSPYLHMPSLPS